MGNGLTELTFSVDTVLLQVLAHSMGWTEMVEDLDAKMEGDEYPLIPNPITIEAFMSQAIPDFIQETVLNSGRNKILSEFFGIHEVIEHQIKQGAFDQMILQGDTDGVKKAVKATL